MMTMDASIVANTLMSATALATVVGAGIKAFWERRRQRRLQPLEDAKATTEIRLSSSQVKQVGVEAERVYSLQRIETERWWLEQFEIVKRELEEERQERRQEQTDFAGWRERLGERLRQHERWDNQQVAALRQANIIAPPPPPLDPDKV